MQLFLSFQISSSSIQHALCKMKLSASFVLSVLPVLAAATTPVSSASCATPPIECCQTFETVRSYILEHFHH